MSSVDTGHLKTLGTDTDYAFNGPHPELLEKFRSPFFDNNPCGADSTIAIRSPEFTSLCPKTGQPDFATIIVKYGPGEWCVESKSFKLYLMSFRNAGEFHEACVNRMCNDLVALLNPRWLTVKGEFTPRGGIPFWPTAMYTRPDQDTTGE